MSLVLLALACTPPLSAPVPVPVAPRPAATWPDSAGALRHPVIEVPPDHLLQRVFVSAGHGAPGNEGNLGSWCTREQEFTLRAADALADLLDATGQFETVRGRTGAQRPSYAARVRHLSQSGATAFVELHSDVRSDGMVAHTTSPSGETCWRDDSEPGFTVLVRDRGEPELVAGRLALARAVAVALADAGFPPWVGDNYEGLYVQDAVPGVWRDRRNLYLLRAPTVPSILIETHNALDTRETLRWEEPETLDAFGRAMIAGLLAYYGR